MVITAPSLLLSSLHRWPDHRMRSPHCNLWQGKDDLGDQDEINSEFLLLTSFARDIMIFSVTKNCCPICAQKGRANSKLKIFFNFKTKIGSFFLVTAGKVSFHLISNLGVGRVGWLTRQQTFMAKSLQKVCIYAIYIYIYWFEFIKIGNVFRVLTCIFASNLSTWVTKRGFCSTPILRNLLLLSLT